MNKTAADNLGKAQYFGSLFGCAISYFIIRYHVPEFNQSFLTLKNELVPKNSTSATTLIEDPFKTKYCDIVAYF